MTPFEKQEIDKWLTEQNNVLEIITDAENRLAFVEQTLNRLMTEAGIIGPEEAPRRLYSVPTGNDVA